MTYLPPTISFIYATILTSTIMCVCARSLHQESFVFARSSCDHCQRKLSWWQLLPVLGWLLQCGRCGHCHQPISVAYPLIELAGGFIGVSLLLNHPPLQLLLFCTFNIILLGLSIHDYYKMTIPTAWLIILMLTSLLIHHRFDRTLGLILIAYLVGSLFCHYHPLIGQGDIDLMAIFALSFGYYQTLLIILFAAVTALIWFKKQSQNTPTPFFPFLCGGAWFIQIAALFY